MIPVRDSYRGQSYKLYNEYNCIHVFIEDSGLENLYEEIFKKCGVTIIKVFSKNGKSSVLEAAALCNDPKCIFIVDRDWDDLLGIDSKLSNVVVLGRHSIENYLIDYAGFSAIVMSDFPRCKINHLLGEDHYNEILIRVSNKLRPLFECFVAMQMCEERRKGCSYKPGHFQSRDNLCAPDENIITQFINDSGVKILQPIIEYFADADLIKKGHGKFMLHFVWEGVRHKTKVSKIAIDKLMIRLAQLVKTSDIKQLIVDIKRKAQENIGNASQIN
jgi:hypothetical protein